MSLTFKLDWRGIKSLSTSDARFLHEFDFTILDMQGFSIEIVQADEKVSTGKVVQCCIGGSLILKRRWHISYRLGPNSIVVRSILRAEW